MYKVSEVQYNYFTNLPRIEMSFFKAKRDNDPVVNLINDGIGFFVGIGILIGAGAVAVLGLIGFAILKMTGVL